MINNTYRLDFKQQLEKYNNGRIDERKDLIDFLNKLIIVCKNSKQRKFMHDLIEHIEKGKHVQLELMIQKGVSNVLGSLIQTVLDDKLLK